MDNNLNTQLDFIFKNINEWLKFAEQKNGALLALNGGIVWGVSRILSNIQISMCFISWVYSIGYMLILASSVICIVSFMPILNKTWANFEEEKSTDNCVYFADIAKYTSTSYLDLLSKKLENSQEKYKNYEIDLSSQIVTNAKIACEKYEKLILSSIFTLSGMLLLLLSILGCKI